ncbi:TPR-like protein, partial [Zopfia rhizophila CBS 207.26]
MAEFVAAASVTAAFGQLIKYGFSFTHGISDFTTRARSARQSLQRLADETQGILSLVTNIQDQPSFDDDDMCDILHRCSDEAKAMQSDLRKLSADSTDGKFTRWRKTVKVVWKERDFTRTLSSLQQRSSSLHEYLVHNSRNVNFIGQAQIFRRMSELIDPTDPHGHDAHHIALTGLGGSGKSEVAREFVFRLRDNTPSVSIFWLDGSTEALFKQEFIQIFRFLRRPRQGNFQVDAASVKTWLQSQSSGPWLMIIDNAHTNTFFGHEALFQYLPSNPGGRIIILSRNWHLALRLVLPTKVIQMPTMEFSDARDLLLSYTGYTSGYKEEISELISTFGPFPLAIAQAGYRIASKTGTFDLDFAARTVVRSHLRSTSQFHQYIYSALYLMESHFPVESEQYRCFEMCQSYSPHVSSVLTTLTGFIPDVQPSHRNLTVVTSLASRLSSFLVTTGSYEAARAMAKSIIDWGISFLTSEMMASCTLRRRLAVAYHYMGRFELARQINAEIIEAQVKTLGNDHIESIHSLNNLALALQAQGKFNEAETHHRHILSVKERLFGREDLETLATINNLGRVLQRQGRHSSAEELFIKAMSGFQTMLGADHPHTLSSMSNLGISLSWQGRFEEAENLHRKTLSGREKVLGHAHHETFKSKANLAVVLHYQGRVREAEEIFRETAKAYQESESLGPSHPDTLECLRNIGILLHTQSRFQEAESIISTVFVTLEQKHGSSHPQVLAVMQHLSVLLQCQGKYFQAVKLGVRVREARIKVLGSDHSDTLFSIQHVKELE